MPRAAVLWARQMRTICVGFAIRPRDLRDTRRTRSSETRSGTSEPRVFTNRLLTMEGDAS